MATLREAAARAREAATRLQQQLDGAQSGAQARVRQEEEAAAALREQLLAETRARQRAEREAEASARPLSLWSLYLPYISPISPLYLLGERAGAAAVGRGAGAR